MNTRLTITRKSDGLEVSEAFSFWAAPVVQHATFDSTGNYISVKFTAPTNRAGPSSSNSSACDTLLLATAALGDFTVNVSAAPV